MKLFKVVLKITADLLREKDINVSATVVDQLLEKHLFRKCKAVKNKATRSANSL